MLHITETSYLRMVIINTGCATDLTHFLPPRRTQMFRNSFTITFVIIWPVIFLLTCHNKTQTHFVHSYLCLLPGNQINLRSKLQLWPGLRRQSGDWHRPPSNSFTISWLLQSPPVRASDPLNYHLQAGLSCKSAAFTVVFSNCSSHYVTVLLATLHLRK